MLFRSFCGYYKSNHSAGYNYIAGGVAITAAELVIPGSSGGRGPEAMHIDGDEVIPRVNDWLEEAVFIGSGLTAARRPGMTIKRLSA